MANAIGHHDGKRHREVEAGGGAAQAGAGGMGVIEIEECFVEKR
jgi:hypothetical protein